MFFFKNKDDISPNDAKALIDKGAVLIDVREPWEYNEAHIPNARMVPLDRLPSAVEILDKTRQIVVYCRSGGRSSKARSFLRSQGFDVKNIDGGIIAWHRSNLPVVSGSILPAGRSDSRMSNLV